MKSTACELTTTGACGAECWDAIAAPVFGVSLLRGVVTLAVLVYVETPPSLNARKRYEYVLLRETLLSVKIVLLAATVAITLKLPVDPNRRSI